MPIRRSLPKVKSKPIKVLIKPIKPLTGVKKNLVPLGTNVSGRIDFDLRGKKLKI